MIVNGEKSFFVAPPGVDAVEVHAIKGGTAKSGHPWYFLQTQTDSTLQKNLLNLSDCPDDSFVVEVWY